MLSMPIATLLANYHQELITARVTLVIMLLVYSTIPLYYVLSEIYRQGIRVKVKLLVSLKEV